MNNKIKTIGAAVLAAVMCASFAGCSKEKDNGVYVDKNGNVSINESKFEDHVNSVFGGDTGTPSANSATSEPEKFKLVVSDEIKNAPLNSGKIQINNDIFQFDAKMTAAEFVEKYKDNYDIRYKDGTYEECKDYLLEYHNFNTGPSSTPLNPLYVESKNTSVIGTFLQVAIDNVTTPDEKITIDKGVVTGCYYGDKNEAVYPGGFMGKDLIKKLSKEDGFVNPNESYNVKTLPEFLEGKGFEKTELSVTANRPQITSADQMLYWQNPSNKSRMGCICCGEKGLNGKTPVYIYGFVFDKDTDKLDYVEYDWFYTDFEHPED